MGKTDNNPLIVRQVRSLSLYLAQAAFRLEPARTAGCRRSRSPARLRHPLHFLEASSHTLISCFAIGVLRPAFSSCYGNASWTVDQAHTGFDLVAMLATWAAGDEEFLVRIALQRFTVGRIWTHHSHYLLVYYLRISLRFREKPIAKVRTIIIIPKASHESRMRLVASAWL